MALSKTSSIWSHLEHKQVAEISEALITGVHHLLGCASADDDLKKETYCWWSSDTTLGEHRIEVVRTTAATIVGLIEFRKLIKNNARLRPSFKQEEDLERKIRGGVEWLCETMVGGHPCAQVDNFLHAKVLPTALESVSGYQAFVYYGSWINVPIHMLDSIREYVADEKSYIKAQLDPKMSEAAKETEIEQRFEKMLEEETTNKHIEACRSMMPLDSIKHLVKVSIPRGFDVECTKDALMALVTYRREYKVEVPQIQYAVNCLSKKRDQNGLWSELICMNFHTLFALLIAEVEPEKPMITDALKYLKTFASEGDLDICLLVSKALVDFVRKGSSRAAASTTLNEYIDEIDNLKRDAPEFCRYGEETPWCYEFQNRKGCAVPQTSWAIYALGHLLEPLDDLVLSMIAGMSTSPPSPTSIAQGTLSEVYKDVQCAEDEIHEELVRAGYTSRGSCVISGFTFSIVYDKRSEGEKGSKALVHRFPKWNKSIARKFVENVRFVNESEGNKIKKVFLIVPSHEYEDAHDVLEKTQQDTGIEFDLRLVDGEVS